MSNPVLQAVTIFTLARMLHKMAQDAKIAEAKANNVVPLPKDYDPKWGVPESIMIRAIRTLSSCTEQVALQVLQSLEEQQEIHRFEERVSGSKNGKKYSFMSVRWYLGPVQSQSTNAVSDAQIARNLGLL